MTDLEREQEITDSIRFYRRCSKGLTNAAWVFAGAASAHYSLGSPWQIYALGAAALAIVAVLARLAVKRFKLQRKSTLPWMRP